MKQVFEKWIGIGELLDRYSFSKKDQVGLVCLDFVGYGIKIVLAYYYYSLLNQVDQITSDFLIRVFAGVTVAIVVSQLCSFMFKKRSEQCAQSLEYELSTDMLHTHQLVSYQDLLNYKDGKWLSVLQSDVSVCAHLFSEFIVAMVRGGLLFVCAVVMGFRISLTMTSIVLTCSLLSGILMQYYQNKMLKAYANRKASDEQVQSFLMNTFRHVEVIKAYEKEDERKGRFLSTYQSFVNDSLAASKKENQLLATSIGSGFTISTLWMIFGMYLIMVGKLTIGAFVAFLMLSDYFNWPFFELPSLFAGILEVKASDLRLQEFFNLPRQKATYKKKDLGKNVVEINHVWFSYDDNDVIKDLSLKIRENEKVAIVGESGTGKSTLMKMLLGLYEPCRGTIYFDEKIEDNHLLSYVPQTVTLFQATILENVRMGNEQASEEEVMEAMRLACVDSFATQLKDRYLTNVHDIKLSGGQVQRIGIARSLLRKAKVYVFDEIASALDFETEKVLLENLLSIEATMIFITHKQSVMDKCEREIRLDNQ